jgi:hypothetical protein
MKGISKLVPYSAGSAQPWLFYLLALLPYRLLASWI